ncbi:MAG: type II toxin-antitoxin system Phd/YefM family antitoxin [Dehalococcoidia bacterium]|nr:type II toxin-antitoxin system Phd/YefM family antitoxin [Dehalococcoidia bacterium]
MSTLSVSTGIVPLGEFKANAAKLLRQLRDSGSPLVITQNGRPAAVLLTPEAYDALVAAAPIGASMDSFSTPPAPPAEDVVGWLDTWAAENEIPLPPAFPT